MFSFKEKGLQAREAENRDILVLPIREIPWSSSDSLSLVTVLFVKGVSHLLFT